MAGHNLPAVSWLMTKRYDRQPDGSGTWAVIDLFTGIPAVFEGVSQAGLSLQEALDLTDFMNELDAARRAKGQSKGGGKHGGNGDH